MIQIIVPVAGESKRFIDQGFIPKPFLPLIDGKSMIEVVEEHLQFLANKSKLNINISFLLKDDHLKNDNYRSILSNLKSNLYKINTPNSGPLATVSQILGNFSNNDQIIIYDCDQLSIFSLSYLIRENRGCILTHRHTDSGMSYLGRGNDGAVERIVEKQSISEEASCGVYFFPSVSIFKEAALHDFSRNNSLNGEFRIANLFNFLIKKGINVDTYKCGRYFNLGTPSNYKYFCKNHILDYKAYLK